MAKEGPNSYENTSLIPTTQENPEALFIQAAKDNKLEDIKVMIDTGFQPSEKTAMLTLGNAVLNENLVMINYILDVIVKEPFKVDSGYFAAVFAACKKSNCVIIGKLLTHPNQAPLTTNQYATIFSTEFENESVRSWFVVNRLDNIIAAFSILLKKPKLDAALFLLEHHFERFTETNILKEALQTLQSKQLITNNTLYSIERIEEIISKINEALAILQKDFAPSKVDPTGSAESEESSRTASKKEELEDTTSPSQNCYNNDFPENNFDENTMFESSLLTSQGTSRRDLEINCDRGIDEITEALLLTNGISLEEQLEIERMLQERQIVSSPDNSHTRVISTPHQQRNSQEPGIDPAILEGLDRVVLEKDVELLKHLLATIPGSCKQDPSFNARFLFIASTACRLQNIDMIMSFLGSSLLTDSDIGTLFCQYYLQSPIVLNCFIASSDIATRLFNSLPNIINDNQFDAAIYLVKKWKNLILQPTLDTAIDLLRQKDKQLQNQEGTSEKGETNQDSLKVKHLLEVIGNSPKERLPIFLYNHSDECSTTYTPIRDRQSSNYDRDMEEAIRVSLREKRKRELISVLGPIDEETLEAILKQEEQDKSTGFRMNPST